MAASFLFTALMVLNCGALSSDLTINVHTDKKVGKIHNFWSTRVITCNYIFENPLDTAELRLVDPFAKYYNFVRFLGGRADDKYDFFKGISSDGQAVCDFAEGLKFLRTIVDAGYTPQIVLDNIPKELMPEGKALNLYGNTEPATDITVWHSYVKQFIEALVTGFGIETVSKWRFRVGTEPDLNPGHWTGTEQQYYEHYDWTVDAVTGVLPQADIGPGNILAPHEKLANKWGLNIIDHCAKGTNYRTHRTGTPMKFFACSYYGEVGKSLETLKQDVELIKQRLHKYEQFENVPVEIHEFAVLRDTEGKTNVGSDATEWAASWMAAVSDKAYQLGIDKIYQWATTNQGIPNPRTHVLFMLESMQGGDRLQVNGGEDKTDSNIGCLAGLKQGGFDLLIYRHETARLQTGSKKIRISLSNLPFAGNGFVFTKGFIIDHEHAGYHHQLLRDLADANIKPDPAYSQYSAAVSKSFGPQGEKLFLDNIEKYRALSRLDELPAFPKLTAREDSISFELEMAGHSVVYLRIDKTPPNM